MYHWVPDVIGTAILALDLCGLRLEAHVIENASVGYTALMVRYWHLAAGFILKSSVIVVRVVILNASSVLGRWFSIWNVFASDFFRMAGWPVQILALTLDSGDYCVAYAWGALVEIDVVYVAIYQNSIVLSNVARRRCPVSLAIYVYRILIGFLLRDIAVSLRQIPRCLILADVLAADDHVQLCFGITVGIHGGDAVDTFWLVIVPVIDHIRSVNIRVLIEILNYYIIIIQLLRIPYIAHLAVLPKALNLLILRASSWAIEFAAVSSWDEGAARVLQPSRRNCFIHYYDLRRFKSLLLWLRKLWLHLEAWYQLWITTNVSRYGAFVASQVAGLLRSTSILILWIGVAIILGLLRGQSKMLGQKIIIFSLQLCILLLGRLILTTIEDIKVYHWALWSLLLLVCGSTGSGHWDVLDRGARVGIVVDYHVGVIEGLVILICDKILIFRPGHCWILVLLVACWLILFSLYDLSRLAWSTDFSLILSLLIIVFTHIRALLVLTEFKQTFGRPLAWHLRDLIVTAHRF